MQSQLNYIPISTSSPDDSEYKNLEENGESQRGQRPWPAGEEGGGEEDEGGDAVGVYEEHVAAHAAAGGELEEGVEADVGALHSYHGREG